MQVIWAMASNRNNIFQTCLEGCSRAGVLSARIVFKITSHLQGKLAQSHSCHWKSWLHISSLPWWIFSRCSQVQLQRKIEFSIFLVWMVHSCQQLMQASWLGKRYWFTIFSLPPKKHNNPHRKQTINSANLKVQSLTLLKSFRPTHLGVFVGQVSSSRLCPSWRIWRTENVRALHVLWKRRRSKARSVAGRLH